MRSERRLCEEVYLNLAYRWFCRLGLEDQVPDHSTFSKNRHGRFRDSELFRFMFESVVERCIDEGLVGVKALRLIKPPCPDRVQPHVTNRKLTRCSHDINVLKSCHHKSLCAT